MPIRITLSSFTIAATIGRWLGRSGTVTICLSSILASLISPTIIFYEVCICQSSCYMSYVDFINTDTLDISWGFVYDPLSATMLVVITCISTCANIYSVEYMRSDPHNIRSFSYLSPLTFFMILPVVSDNAVQLFVGWEGVGICSYSPINFRYTRIQANKSSILAVMANKVGDIASSLSISISFQVFHTLDLSIISSCAETIASPSNMCVLDINTVLMPVSVYMLYEDSIDTLSHTGYNRETHTAYVDAMTYTRAVCVFAIIAAIGKSAQAGLHVWLPEAMEGPTPVSSLTHAATMVTAGIFLLVRFAHIFTSIGSAYVYIILVGSITASFSSTIGLSQNDIKKVVAYSTCSQSGYMFVCCGFTAYSNSMYHLVNHAFFKALLFPTAGYIIHALGNEQDIRRMGGLLRASPPPYTSMLIGSLSLVGFPFPSGFYPKDKIIELCFNNYIGVADVVSTYRYIIFAQILCILAVIFTSIYSIKLLFYVFPNSYCGFKSYVTQLHFSTIYIQMPPVFLSITSITSGYLTTDMMVGLGTTFRMKSLYIDTFITADSINIFKVQFPLHTEYNSYIRNITVVRTIYFIFGSIAPLLYIKHFSLHALLGSVTWVRHLYTIIAKKYVFINRLVLHPAVNRIMIFAYEVTYKCLDKGIVEFVGPFGITHSIAHLAKPQYLLQSGLIYHYPGFMFIFIMIIIHITPDVQFI